MGIEGAVAVRQGAERGRHLLLTQPIGQVELGKPLGVRHIGEQLLHRLGADGGEHGVDLCGGVRGVAHGNLDAAYASSRA